MATTMSAVAGKALVAVRRAVPVPFGARCSRHVVAMATRHQQAGMARRTFLAAPLVLAAAVAPGGANADDAAALITAPNGLQFVDIVEGSGPTPAKGSLIRCHYEGKLTNGKVFDSSYSRGRPLSFKIGVREVISGWDIGILGDESGTIPPMKEGGKRQLVIPSDLAYGSRGAGGVIPPNATLIFTVELLKKQ